MSKIIGITGYMGAGKTYIGKKICKNLKNCYFLEVDIFRRNLLKNNFKYRKRLEGVLGLNQNWDGNELNKIIYQNEEAMQKYKKILYEFLNQQIESLSYDYIIVEWALLVQDHLLPFLDILILVEASPQIRLKRVCALDLSIEEIKQRMSLQEKINLEQEIKKYQMKNSNFQYFVIQNGKDGES
ncbi:MAG: dephospho-CoA kinase [Bacilli bacterium]|nr:dephospho-CoA kinase [Bacilli bacterium]